MYLNEGIVNDNCACTPQTPELDIKRQLGSINTAKFKYLERSLIDAKLPIILNAINSWTQLYNTLLGMFAGIGSSTARMVCYVQFYSIKRNFCWDSCLFIHDSSQQEMVPIPR